jgi:hypothetical protein
MDPRPVNLAFTLHLELIMRSLATLGFKPLMSIAAGAAFTLGLAWVSGQPASAQYVAPGDPLQENTFSGEGNSDPFSGSGNSQTSGAFELFHRANLGLSVDPVEFQRQQQENISTEAENYRSLQRARFQETQQAQPDDVVPVTPEQN